MSECSPGELAGSQSQYTSKSVMVAQVRYKVSAEVVVYVSLAQKSLMAIR